MENNKKISAGIILYTDKMVFLVFNGGPIFEGKKHMPCWTIPKGVIESGENPEDTARREFLEETGIRIGEENVLEFLGVSETKYKNVHVYACRTTGNERFIESNTFMMEYPKGSGVMREYPEIVDGKWFELDEAKKFISAKYESFIEHIENIIKYC